MLFLLGSRYCETDLLSQIAWDLFGKSPTGWERVQAICDFVHQDIAFGYEHPPHEDGLGGFPGEDRASATITRTSPSPSVAV